MEPRPYLEPIQEVSEQEDEISGSNTGEGDEESFQAEIGVETEELTTEDEGEGGEEEEEQEEEEGGSAFRSRLLPRSLSGKNVLQTPSTFSHQDQTESFTLSDSTTPSVAVGEKSTSPGPPRLEKLKWPSGVKIKLQKQLKQSVQKKKKRESRKKESVSQEMFPRWLVDLMFNIEEATTHQLVVE
ncbi:hypothetical protein Q5P01_022523 [Channa striata]|uniref:Uncharacterized protein n=1 Tax=Channa striata TaxID=64152 RepID=A0AA88IXJ2_CHASR|nr:hypothetical protein Q5P01_022523 [Channa striata]